MLKPLSDYSGLILKTVDDEDIGEVKDFYFDDETWTVRYMIVSSEKGDILISTFSVREFDRLSKSLKSNLSAKKVISAPRADLVRPVSKLEEERLANYYGWPMYWVWGGATSGVGMYPPEAISSANTPEINEYYQKQYQELQAKIEKSTLRSYKEIIHYGIDTGNEKFGQVEDLLVDDDTFKIRYVVIDTIRFFPSKNVLVASEWIEDVSWDERVFRTNLSKESIKKSPSYEKSHSPDRNFEEKLHANYGLSGYWERNDNVDEWLPSINKLDHRNISI